MGFAFDETMSGTMERVDQPGQAVPFSFSIHVHAPSLGRHLRDGKATLRGTVEAPGLAASAALEGEITMRPLGRRLIRYEFEFDGDDGRRYRFAGQKDIRWTDLRRSWTTLPGEITDAAGALVARCLTRFDARADWLQFASSWRPA
ncbi:MAG: hypothetical protein H6709_00820 [Kofleriaceae bacterium]|nr:hypothetical protein [Myxococcales bacterium]MCB9558835.1 hypothetical protein [Kofleriaceae bacterium]MCB9570610.1 hypothetical protein [Kofleriaceae bacterium]